MIVVFDGRCLLCNRWVQFLLRHDRHGRIRYASVQGATGGALLRDAGRRWQHTGAILRLLHALGGPWRLAWAAWLVPAPLRDAAYRLLARNRYRVFGRADACMQPPPGTAGRFLD